MAEQGRFSWKTRALLIVAGLGAFLLYVYFFVPINRVVETVQRANPIYFLLALCMLFLSAAFSSLAWQRLLKQLSARTRFLKTFQLIWVENFVDLVLPGEPISGDASRVYLMSKEPGQTYEKVVASVVGHRILTTLVAAGALIISILYFAVYYSPPLFVLEFTAAVAVGDAILVALLFFLSIRKEATKKIVNSLIKLLNRVSLGHWQFEHLRERAEKMLDVFHEEFMALGRHPKGWVLPTLFSVLAWVGDALVAILVFLSLGSLGIAISLSAIVIVYSITGAIQNIPVGIIPGEVGLTEIVMTSLFTLLGNPQAIAIFAVATVLIRILTLWVKLMIGAVVVQALGIKSLMPSAESQGERNVGSRQRTVPPTESETQLRAA